MLSLAALWQAETPNVGTQMPLIALHRTAPRAWPCSEADTAALMPHVKGTPATLGSRLQCLEGQDLVSSLQPLCKAGGDVGLDPGLPHLLFQAPEPASLLIFLAPLIVLQQVPGWC